MDQRVAVGLGLAGAAAVGAVLLLPRATGLGPRVHDITFTSDRSSGPVPFAPNLSGRALDASGNAVPGASLDFMVNGSKVATATTDGSGAFSLQAKFPDPGTYACQMRSGNATSSVLTLVANSPNPVATGYSIGFSPKDILNYGIPTLNDAITQAKNWQENSQPNPPTIYIYDSSGQLVQTVTWTAPTGAYLLEIFDMNGIRVFQMSYPSLDAAVTYIKTNYTIVPAPGIGASGTYDIYDSQSAIAQYGYIV